MTAAEPSNPLRSEASFAAAVGPHRAELRVHCYRMLGSFEDGRHRLPPTCRGFGRTPIG
ncbi:MAG TPA: hypothetical protein VG126_14890 [Thermoleophilaceae bacterium]|nr:hypothetical protein [Thermoleophilaceae bacterium]